jgi:hypothetical protein
MATASTSCASGTGPVFFAVTWVVDAIPSIDLAVDTIHRQPFGTRALPQAGLRGDQRHLPRRGLNLALSRLLHRSTARRSAPGCCVSSCRRRLGDRG